jgi:PAS domain S-box-containing protein
MKSTAAEKQETKALKTKILLVDDNQDSLHSMAAVLEPLGQEILTAGSGKEALKHLLKCDPAVIVLDVMMPEMDGFELASLIRQRERLRNTPIIFLTGLGRDDRRILQGYQAGAVDYLFKPCDPEILRSKVGVFVELARKSETLRQYCDLMRANSLHLEEALAETLKAKADLEREIEQRKQAEQSRDRLAGQLGATPDFVAAMAEGAVALGLDGSILYCNERFAEMTERLPAELVGSPVFACLAPDYLETFSAILTESSKTRTSAEVDLQSRSGERIPVRLALTSFRYAGIAALAMVVTDLRDQKHNEQMLAEGRLARLILEHSHSGMLVCDVNGRITLASSAVAEMCGSNPISRHFDNALPLQSAPGSGAEPFSIMDVLKGASHKNTEVELRCGGAAIPLLLSAVPVTTLHDGVIGCVVTLVDISERKSMEAALRRSEKLAAAGRIAGALAHEVNNPLSAMGNVLFILEGHPSLDETARHYLKLASGELERVSHIVRRTLAFYRDTSAPTAVNVRELVDNIVEVFSIPIAEKRIEISRRYEYTGPVVGFPGELRQVASNVICNAIEAVTSGGHITVHVREGREWSGGGRAGVQLIVADRGHGIRSEHFPKLFEPFFTTKEDKGTGLGLWVVHGIVQKHGGSIRVRSSATPGRSGTVVRIFIPMKPGGEMAARDQIVPNDTALETADSAA